MAGTLPLKWRCCNSGSTQCSPGAAAAVRSTATATRRCLPRWALHAKKCGQGVGGAALTVGRVLKSLSLGPLKSLQPAESVRRYQWAMPSDILNFNTLQLGHFGRVVTRSQAGSQPGFLPWY
jgi:hypothetical protein